MRTNGVKLEPRKMMCTICGTHQEIMRRKARIKEVGHIKHLWCIKCENRTAHKEEGMS
jgi:hypothetical protein